MTASPVRQAIVLGAGLGQRLRPITLVTPKPLVPFYGRPLLDWAIAKLVLAGVERIAVNAFHLAHQVRDHVEALRPRYPELELALSHEPALLGTGGAVRHLRHWLRPEPFYVLNSDALFEAPARSLAAAPSLLVTRAEPWAAERRIVAPDGRWRALVETTQADAYTFCGLTLADAELPARLPDGASCILRQGFLPWLEALDVRVVPTAGFFADTGTPRLLVDAHVRGQAWVSAGPPELELISRGTSRG